MSKPKKRAPAKKPPAKRGRWWHVTIETRTRTTYAIFARNDFAATQLAEDPDVLINAHMVETDGLDDGDVVHVEAGVKPPARVKPTLPIVPRRCGGKFDGCTSQPTPKPHTCPFDVNVNNDRTKSCHCCNRCTDACALET